uniref:Uncharacterized protein n=1 Tax=Timema bartmani TaxID=61472 RepID=A0A7R9F488_9NEOP|nr:unnamed protein product [Timema bartmani]
MKGGENILSQSAFKQQTEKLLGGLEETHQTDIYIKMYAEGDEITREQFNELLLVAYRLAMDFYPDGPPRTCLQLYKVLKAVVDSAFHRKDCLPVQYLSNWVSSHCPRLVVGLHRYVVHALTTTYRTLGKDQTDIGPVVVPKYGMADNLVTTGTILTNSAGISLPGPLQGRNIDTRWKRMRPPSPILEKSRKCPFILERAINGAAKSDVSIRKLRDGTILIQTATDVQSSNIMAITEIPSSNTAYILVKVKPHRFLNVCKGVVTCFDLDCVSIEEIFNLAKTSTQPVPLVSDRDIHTITAPNTVATKFLQEAKHPKRFSPLPVPQRTHPSSRDPPEPSTGNTPPPPPPHSPEPTSGPKVTCGCC